MSKKTNVVTVNSMWEYGKVDHSQENENHLLINLKAGKKEAEEKRKPAAIEAVVDCSGSMSGTKIKYVINTLLVLVDNLTEDDYLGVVGYGSSVWQIAPPTQCDASGKETLKNLIRKNTQISGCTNLSGGYVEGFEALGNMDVGSDFLKRVLLLTDGLANEGVADYSGLCKLVKQTCGEKDCNISLSTFGYGDGHDAELLRDMAKHGGGNFHYISNPDQAPKALGLEIGGLLSVVAQGIKINLDLNDNVELLDVLNDFDVDTKDGITTISVDDIYSEEEKNIVVKFNLPSMTKAVSARPNKKVLSIGLKYLNVDSGKSEDSKTDVKVAYVKAADADTEPNKEVEKQIVIQNAADLQEAAVEAADLGDYNKAQSILEKAKAGVRKCTTFAKDKVLQGLAKDIEESIPRYQAHTYSGGVKSAAFANISSAKLCRSATGGGTIAAQYTNSAMDMMSASLSDGVDAYNDEDDDSLYGPDPGPSTGGVIFDDSTTWVGDPPGSSPWIKPGPVPTPPTTIDISKSIRKHIEKEESTKTTGFSKTRVNR